jgi:hypothetical protein
MVMLLLAALAVAQMPATPSLRPTRPSVVDCRLSRMDSEMRPEVETHRFALLLGAPQAQGPLHPIRPAQIQVYDPHNLLMGLRLAGAYYSEAPDQLFASTARDQPVIIRLFVSLPQSAGTLSMGGTATPAEQRAHLYNGRCSVSAPPDPVSRFEEIRHGQ